MLNSRQRHHLKRLIMRSPSLIFSFIFGVSLMCYGIGSLMYSQSFAKVREFNRRNKWLEVTIPSLLSNDEGSKFIYKNLIKGEDKCINRSHYVHEFRRVFDEITSVDDYDAKRMLIIGAQTAIGQAMIRKYQRKSIPITAIKSIYDVDFSSETFSTLFTNFSFKSAFVVYQPPPPRFGTATNESFIVSRAQLYFKYLLKFLNERQIPFVVALPSSHIPDLLEKVMKIGGLYVDVPYTVDSEAIYDLDNPLMRAARECYAVGRTEVMVKDTDTVHSIDSDTAAKFLRKQMKEGRSGHFSIYGASNISIKQAIYHVAGPQCKITFKEFPNISDPHPLSEQTALVGNENADVKEMLINAFKHFQSPFDKKPYLSIVVTGRNDNFSNGFLARTNNFIKSLEYNFKKEPLTSFEVVFVDYAGPTDKPPLSEVVEIPPLLKKRFRFITVPTLFHMHISRQMNASYPFLEYVAKNIGVRRSFGRMIATMNPDDIIPPDFFTAAAGKQFSRGALYRMIRWDLKENWTDYTNIDEVLSLTGSSDDMAKLGPNVFKARCQPTAFYTPIASKQDFDNFALLCGSGDFMMLSKHLWGALNGFIEYPANPNIDAAMNAKMMRLLPGYVLYVHQTPLLHQYHPRKNVRRHALENHDAIMQEFICKGVSTLLAKYPDKPTWGYAGENFEEVRK